MKKIYLIIAGAFLVLLIIISMVLSFGKKSITNTQKNSLFPTGIPDQGSTYQGKNQNGENLSNADVFISKFEPMETLDFKAAYVPDLGKIVVEKKTPQAEELFYQWIDQSQLNEIINDNNEVLFTDEKIIPTPSDSIHKLEDKVKGFFQLLDDLNSISTGADNDQSSNIETPTPSINNDSQSPNPLPITNNQSRIYYAQCGDFSSLGLPNGCTLCNAGCGPTAVSMIASSYLGSQYDPKTIVDLYKSKGFLLGCGGSYYFDAKQILQNLGLKTTDYLIFNLEKAETVVPQLKKYLEAGWTFFALANFKEVGGGHFFWITDIDSQGNIFAYDSAYGRYQIPYNENSRYPYPLYRLAFGVKK